jgi:hypothetical protein
MVLRTLPTHGHMHKQHYPALPPLLTVALLLQKDWGRRTNAWHGHGQLRRHKVGEGARGSESDRRVPRWRSLAYQTVEKEGGEEEGAVGVCQLLRRTCVCVCT